MDDSNVNDSQVSVPPAAGQAPNGGNPPSNLPPPVPPAAPNAGQAGTMAGVPPPSTPTEFQGPSLKEQKELLTTLKSQEQGLDTVKYKEFKEVEIGHEVQDWLQKLETGDSSQLPQPVIDDYGQILLDNSVPQKPQIILPLEEEEVEKALHHKIVDSIRWLAEWCLRVIKMVGKRAVFSK